MIFSFGFPVSKNEQRVIALLRFIAHQLPRLSHMQVVFKPVSEGNFKISLAPVYQILRLFEEANILNQHKLGNEGLRYKENPFKRRYSSIDCNSFKIVLLDTTLSCVEFLSNRMRRKLKRHES